MDDITMVVIETLKTHKDKKRKIQQLKYELDNLPRISEDEIIDSLVLGSSLPGMAAVSSNHISNKTMMIAMKFRDAGAELMSEVVGQIVQELCVLEAEVGRLEHYISLLPDKLSAVIRLYYFEGMQNTHIAEELHISAASLAYRKSTAIKELVSMYQFLCDVKE